MDKFQNLFQRGGLSMDRLRNFCLVAEVGGLTRAAGGDPGRMSLYSRQIKELEAFFGVELTRRVGKTMAITEAGRRLATLARGYLDGLADFQAEGRKLPRKLSLGTGNSVIQWMLIPRVGALRKALPDHTVIEFHGLRTQDVVDRLEDMTLDLGIIRTDARTAALKSSPLPVRDYALFVPKRLLERVTPGDLPTVLETVPLATSMGGAFRERLEGAAARAKLPLRIELGCSSFTQAARAVGTGRFGAVLPAMASADFDPAEVLQLPLSFLKSALLPLCLAWNPRLADMRPAMDRARDTFASVLRQAA
ncbi:MAG: LysR family transcriptional regulator [Verrucomicrobiia bacterium]